jgi:hypothetical protein
MFTSSVSPLALDPAVPYGHLLSIDRQTKGFFRRRTRLVNRFLVRWEKDVENPHRASPTAGMVLRSSRRRNDLRPMVNLIFQSELVKQGRTSRAVHGVSHKLAISSITETESMEMFRHNVVPCWPCWPPGSHSKRIFRRSGGPVRPCMNKVVIDANVRPALSLLP